MPDGTHKAAKPYSQAQMLLPLLAVLDQSKGATTASAACEAVAKEMRLPDDIRQSTVSLKDGEFRAFDRDLRWAQQRAKAKGLIETPSRGHWQITGKGRGALREARPGVVITLYETDRGIALWASCEDAAGVVASNSVKLIVTSPPYPLIRKKDYGNLDERDHINWLASLADQWRNLLTPDGSLVLNLGDTWEKGRPTQSLYAERLLLRLVDDLGYRLCQRFEFYSPSKMPAPAEWVTIRRVRVKPALERVYWLSQSDHPYANNRSVLVPYSSSMRKRLAEGGEMQARRPSGYTMAAGAFSTDNGGAIPSNLLTASHTVSNSHYLKACREAGLPPHPARFPGAIPNFFVRLLTRPGDTVYDPFAGSNTTGEEAEKLERNWISSERALEYGLGSASRFGLRLAA